jgi:hypothetical protein
MIYRREITLVGPPLFVVVVTYGIGPPADAMYERCSPVSIRKYEFCLLLRETAESGDSAHCYEVKSRFRMDCREKRKILVRIANLLRKERKKTTVDGRLIFVCGRMLENRVPYQFD